MGHSKINTTLDVYGHLMNTVNNEAAQRLEIAVFGKNGDFLETLERIKTEKALNNEAKCLNFLNAPDTTRTCDLGIRNPLLYPN